MERRLHVHVRYLFSAPATKVNRPTGTCTVLVSNVRHLPMQLIGESKVSVLP